MGHYYHPETAVMSATEAVAPPWTGPLDAIAFLGWLAQAEPGDRLTYFTGQLGLARHRHTSSLPAPERIGLDRLAATAMAASDQDGVHLVQQRLAPDLYAYSAVARSGAAVVAKLLATQPGNALSTETLLGEPGG